ncbi:COP9 signalosome complex subunit 1 [Taenia solium]|eukprot:TsM_000795600 transcript=TsM_000795600 gene=TsM_000795600
MSESRSESPTSRKNQKKSPKFVNEPVQIDLPSYAASYSGPIKYLRLLFIAQMCPALKGQALRLAHDYIKASTLNVSAYEQIFEVLLHSYNEKHGSGDSLGGGEASNNDRLSSANAKIVKSGRNEAGLIYDEDWVEKTTLRAARNRDELETELKNFKVNAIKECTRKGYVDLANFCLNVGELSGAMKYYTRSREYCTSWQQDLNSCLSIVKVSIYQAAWSHAGAYVSMAENFCEAQNSESPPKNGDTRPISPAVAAARSELALASGLIKLVTCNYQDATTQFLQANCDPDECTADKAASLLTSTNVAYCVTLCALATLDRGELRSRVLNSPTFRLILEAEAECRDIISAFYSANYAACLDALGKIKNFLKLDLFLADHVDSLYERIRMKAMCQYFVPYVCADLKLMAEVFRTNVTDLENELAELIRKGHIKGRIDSEKQLLCSLKVDPRYQTFSSTISIIDQCHQRLQAALLRSNLIRRGYTRGWH